MKNAHDTQKLKIQNQNQNFETYDIGKDSKLLPHCETEIGLDKNNSCESLSNIIDVLSNNNLNLFYQDDSTNFKRNIDNLNLKFYFETEKLLSTNNNDSNNLFLILFKQITLYIKEIERLNVIILGMKKDEQSAEKLASFLERREMDFETKDNIIKALQYSNNTLEKKISNLILSESNLKQENMRLIKENMFYKNNNSSNSNINNNNQNKIMNSNDKKKVYFLNDKAKTKTKNDTFNNKRYIKSNLKYNFNKTNNDTNVNNTITNNNNSNNNNNHSLSNSNKKVNKINKENNKKNNNNNENENDSKSIIISVKRDEHLLIKRHRRNYSDQIGVGVLIQENVKSIYNKGSNGEGSKKIIKNNCQIKNNNKNNIISLGASTPKANPVPIKNNHLSKVNIKKNIKNSNSKSIKNDKKKKILPKKKTDNVTNKSKHIDLISNNDKDCSMTKYSSSIFNKSNIYSQGNGNISINITENNYDFLIDNEIDDLSMLENLLNQVKDYIKGNISSSNTFTNLTPSIIKINCHSNSNTNIKKGVFNVY